MRRCFDTCSRVEDWCGVCSVWAWLVGGAAELGHSSNIRDLMMITDQDGLLWIRGSCHQHRATRLNLKRISASLQPWYQPRASAVPCHWSPGARCRGQLQVATFSWQLPGLPLQLKSVFTEEKSHHDGGVNHFFLGLIYGFLLCRYTLIQSLPS